MINTELTCNRKTKGVKKEIHWYENDSIYRIVASGFFFFFAFCK